MGDRKNTNNSGQHNVTESVTNRTQKSTGEDVLFRDWEYRIRVAVEVEPRMVYSFFVTATSAIDACHKVGLRGIASPHHGVLKAGDGIKILEVI